MPDHPSPKAHSKDAFGALLQQAGVTPQSHILVTGPSGLAALLWLCRHGYDHVGYVRPGGGGAEQAEVLIVAHTCDTATMERIVHAPHMNAARILIVQCACRDAVRLQGLLDQEGFAAEMAMHGPRRDLIVARRRQPLLSRAA